MSAIYYLDTAEISRLLKTNKRNVQMWCKRGQIAGARKVGKKWIVPHVVIDAFRAPKRGRPRSIASSVQE